MEAEGSRLVRDQRPAGRGSHRCLQRALEEAEEGEGRGGGLRCTFGSASLADGIRAEAPPRGCWNCKEMTPPTELQSISNSVHSNSIAIVTAVTETYVCLDQLRVMQLPLDKYVTSKSK